MKKTARKVATRPASKKSPARKAAGARKASPPAKKRSAAKRVAKTSAKKPASTTLTIKLDNSEQRVWLPKQPDLALTESELIAKACALGNTTPEVLVREAILAKAKSLTSTALSPASAVATHGIVGSADARLEKALALCQKTGIEITPTYVGDRAEPPVSYRTTKRFLQRKGLLKI